MTRVPFTVRVIDGLSRRISRLGERLGSDALTYNFGTFLSFHREGLRHAPLLADALLNAFPHTRSVADVGCGTGTIAAEFQRRGLTTLACEYMPRARRFAARLGVAAIPFDLSNSTAPMPGTPVDLAYSFEVGEHIPAPLADAFVDYLAATGHIIVLTCAQPGQGGQGHINEQPRSYWITKFAARGWQHDDTVASTIADQLRQRHAADYLCNNMMVFRRSANSSYSTASYPEE